MLSVDIESAFEVCYLGMVQNVNLGVHLSQKSDVLLIDKIEEAQVDLLNILSWLWLHVGNPTYNSTYSIYRISSSSSSSLHLPKHRQSPQNTANQTANHRSSPQIRFK